MAISYVGGGQSPMYTGGQTTMHIPATAHNGDLAVLFYFHSSSPLTSFEAPSGWTQVGDTVASDTDGSGIESRAYIKLLADSDADTDQVFTASGAGLGLGLLSVYRGTDGTVSDHGVDSQKVTGTDRVAPSVTVPAGGALVECVCDRVSQNVNDWVVPTGFVERARGEDVNNLDVAVLADKVAATGEDGGDTFGKTTQTPRYAIWSLALSPKVEAQDTVAPSTVVENGGNFTNEGGAADITAALGDGDDATYIQSPDSPSGASITLGMPALSEGDVTVKVRHSASAASPAISRKYELLQGSTVVASRTVTLPSAVTAYQFTTTAAQTATITDYSALRLRVTDSTA